MVVYTGGMYEKVRGYKAGSGKPGAAGVRRTWGRTLLLTAFLVMIGGKNDFTLYYCLWYTFFYFYNWF